MGTPIGAGPGSESENVGLLADGTPLPVGRFLGGLGFLACACLDALCVEVVCCCPGTCACACDEDFWPWLAVGAAVVDERLVVVLDELLREGEVEVEPDVVLEPEELLELDGGGGALVLLVVVVDVLVLVLAGVQVPDTKVAPAGSAIEDGFVPDGTLSKVSVWVWPVTSLTVTVHVSAAAVVLPNTSAESRATAPASTAINFGRLITAALVLRPTWFVRTPMRKRKDPACHGSY